MTAPKKGANGGNSVFPVPNDVPIDMFDLVPGKIQRVLAGARIGTVISTNDAKASNRKEGGGGGDDR